MKAFVRYCLLFLITLVVCVLIISFYANLDLFVKNETADLIGPSVFFMETNASQRHVSVVCACSVESAAKHHPRSPIIFYKVGTAFDPDSPLLLSLRRHYPNIRFEPLDPSQLFRGTPLQDENGSAEDEMREKIEKSWYSVDHMSDVVRVALLWKYGGIYLDTDAIVLRPLDTFENTLSIASQELDERIVNTAVMMFEKSSAFLYKYLRGLRYWFSVLANVREAPGPYFLTYWSEAECGVSFLSRLPLNAPERCGGLNILPHQVFNKISFTIAKYVVFSRPEIVPIDLTEAYVFHLNHYMTMGMSTPVGSGTHLDLIFKENCPVVYEQIEGGIIAYGY